MSKIDRQIAVPMYQQIAADIKNKIQIGEYKENSKIPTEFELEKIYEVSRITIRKALELLVDDDILARKQRMGTFVMPNKISWNLNSNFSFSKVNEQAGHSVRTELLGAELKKARQSDIVKLNLNDDMILCVKRLRYVDDKPIEIEELHFSRIYAYLLMEDLTGSLYDLLTKHGVRMASATKSISLCYATKEEAQALNTKEEGGLLLIKNTFFDNEKKPVFIAKEVINAEHFEYRINLLNNE